MSKIEFYFKFSKINKTKVWLEYENGLHMVGGKRVPHIIVYKNVRPSLLKKTRRQELLESGFSEEVLALAASFYETDFEKDFWSNLSYDDQMTYIGRAELKLQQEQKGTSDGK